MFRQIKEYLNTGILLEKPSIEEVIAMILRHTQLQIQVKGEYTGIREMRKHVAWYTSGYKQSAKLRSRVNEITDMECLENLLMEWKEKIK